MSLDLLSQYASHDVVPTNHIDSVLALRLDEVEEDPDQPRQAFNEDMLARLVQDIIKNGQRMPIIVRPAVNGVYRIVHGARRYRAVRSAGMDHIRAIVETDNARCDDFSQWAENARHENLTPIETALFISKHVRSGKNQQEVALRMGENKAFVSLHLALLKMPDVIRVAYDAGAIPAVRAAYDLSRLHRLHRDAVEAFVASHEEITLPSVYKLAESLHADLRMSETEDAYSRTTHTEQDSDDTPRASAENSTPSQPRSFKPGVGRGITVPRDRIGHLLLKGNYEGRAVEVLLHKRRSAGSLVHVNEEGGAGDVEVPVSALTNLTLSEVAMSQKDHASSTVSGVIK